MHGAICLNKQCDEPVSIPWKEDCQLVRKPEKNVEENGEAKTEKVENTEDLSKEMTKDGGDSKDAFHCKECGTKYTEKHADVFVKTMEFTHVHLQNMERASVACILFENYFMSKAGTVIAN